MGLPASQRRALEEIENELQGSDARLTSLFSIFARLNHNEEMPRSEQLRARAALIVGRIQFRLSAIGNWLGARPRLRTALFFPMAAAAMTSALLIGLAMPSSARCAAPPRASGAQQAGPPPRARTAFCTRPVKIPAFFGR